MELNSSCMKINWQCFWLTQAYFHMPGRETYIKNLLFKSCITIHWKLKLHSPYLARRCTISNICGNMNCRVSSSTFKRSLPFDHFTRRRSQLGSIFGTVGYQWHFKKVVSKGNVYDKCPLYICLQGAMMAFPHVIGDLILAQLISILIYEAT